MCYVLPNLISLRRKGTYKLIETKNQTKVLLLDGTETYAWVNLANIGEILVTSHNIHKTDNVLAVGKYQLFDVKDEPKLADLLHLELQVGGGQWQGYLLLTGLPTDADKRNRIIPTHEIISTNPELKKIIKRR